MKVIKKGKLPSKKIFRVTCDNCDTVFEFEQVEARYVSDFRDGDYLVIDCPICKKEVTTNL